jgi:hypothetical protein
MMAHTSHAELIGRATRVMNRNILNPEVREVICDLRDAIGGLPKRPAIELLEAEVERYRKREQDLLEANNGYLERARIAEAKLREKETV